MLFIAQELSRAVQSICNLVKWLSILMIIITSAIVSIRYFFSVGSVAAQELVIYLHASLVLLCLAYGSQLEAHVRVDIFYRRFSPLTKAWVNMLGSICLLLPFSLFFLAISWNFAANSWKMFESSANPSGIPAVFLLKSLLPLAGALLTMQTAAIILRELHFITYCKSETPEG